MAEFYFEVVTKLQTPNKVKYSDTVNANMTNVRPHV